MGRLSSRGSVLEVDFAQATLSWDFRGPSEAPLSIVSVTRLLVCGSECFAVCLHGRDGTAEIRLVCASDSVRAPKALTVLIVECDIADGIVPTVLCAAAGGDVAPGLDGKVILAVGSSEGAVTLFDVNQVFRLGPCQENHLRTGDTAVVSWEDFCTFCGRPVLGLPDTSTDTSPVIALRFIPSGGCLHQAHLAIVRCDNGGKDSSTSLVLANLTADASRTRSLAHKLPFQTQYELGHLSYCDLCHVHMPPEKHDRSLGRVGHTLLWVITNHVALVLQPSPGGANPRSGNQSSVEEVHRFEASAEDGTESFLGVVPQPSNMCVLMRMRTGSRAGASVCVDLVDLLCKAGEDIVVDSVSVDANGEMPRGFRLARRDEIQASVCVQCETSRSLTQSTLPSLIEFVKVSTPILSQERAHLFSAEPSSLPGGRHHKWITAIHMTPRAQAIKEIKGFGRDILTLSDDSFVSRLATSYNGIGLDEEAIIIRERIHQSTSLSELLSSLDSRILNNIPILRDVLREIINSEKQFSENSDARARARALHSKAVLDAVLDVGRLDIICSLLVRADGRAWQSVNLWARELLVVYAVVLDQCIVGPVAACLGDAHAKKPANSSNSSDDGKVDSSMSTACAEKMSRLSSLFLSLRSVFEASLDTVQETFEGYGSEADLHSLSSTTESMFDMANVCLWFLNYSGSEGTLSFDSLHSATHASGSMPERRSARREVESHDAQELIGGGEAAFEGGGAAGPLQSSVSLSSRRPLLFGEELALLVERGCPGTFAVLQSGHEASSSAASKAAGVYFPPRRFQDLMYMFLVGEEAMVGKSCLALYTVLDLCYVATATASFVGTTDAQNRELAYVAEDFASACGIDEPTKTAVLALWHIDNHGNIHLAVDLLLSEYVTLEPGWHFKVVRAIADGWTSGRDALHYMRSLGLEPITASEAVIAVRLLLQCGSWEEAFDAQRKICDNFLRLGELEAGSVWQLRQNLICMCFQWLMTTPERVQFLLRLPVRSGDEETVLTKFLTLAAFGNAQKGSHTSTAALGVLLAHLVFHSKIEEARCIEAIASASGQDGRGNLKAHDVALGRIMQSFKSLSPAASRLRQDRNIAAAVAESQKLSGINSISTTVLKILRGIFKLNGPSSLEARENNVDEVNSLQQSNSVSESFAQSFAAENIDKAPNRLRTPAKSLLRVAATSNPKDFAKKYSPSMLSPVVKGLSPFSTGLESTEAISAEGQKNRSIGAIPSTPSRLRLESSMDVADRIISEMDRRPPRRASLRFGTK